MLILIRLLRRTKTRCLVIGSDHLWLILNMLINMYNQIWPQQDCEVHLNIVCDYYLYFDRAPKVHHNLNVICNVP